MLSSEDVLRSAVNRWQTHDPCDTGRSLDSTEGESIHTEVRHIQAIKCGRPFALATIDDTRTRPQGPRPNIPKGKMDLNGNRIAYLSSHQGQGDAVIIRDLVSGKTARLCGDARERIMFITLTSKLLAFVTFEGYLYYARFSESRLGTTHRVRLPSSHIRACSGDGDFIALAIGYYCNQGSSYIAEMLLFNAQSARLESCDVSEELDDLVQISNRMRSCSILVNSDKGIVDIFYFYYGVDRPTVHSQNSPYKFLRVVHFRVSFNRVIIDTDEWEERIKSETLPGRHIFTMSDALRTGFPGRYRIFISEVSISDGLPSRYNCDVLFDARNGRFILDDDRISSQCPYMQEVHEGDGPPIAAKSRYLRTVRSKPNPGSDLHAIWKGRILQPVLNEEAWLEYMFLMNDTFAVSLEVSRDSPQHSRIRVLCYDESVEMADSAGTGFWEDEIKV